MFENKILIDESTEGVTYIGTATYSRDGYEDTSSYKKAADKGKEIWQIKKVAVVDGVTEISFPNGDNSCKYNWNNRTSYTYL